MMPSTESMDEFVASLDDLIEQRKKMTSPLYQLVLKGAAPQRLLQQFVIHRYPIKNHWSRNILGIASRVDDVDLRRELIENIYEEETGALTKSRRHLDAFINFGIALGLTRDEIVESEGSMLPETAMVIDHNVRACNRDDVHFTVGVASVLLLMEGQPPIVSGSGSSMEKVMREAYGLPTEAVEFFTHHASGQDGEAVSEIEDDHAETARRLLRRYCTNPTRMADARDALKLAIDLRHKHFDAIYERFYHPTEPPFRAREVSPA